MISSKGVIYGTVTVLLMLTVLCIQNCPSLNNLQAVALVSPVLVGYSKSNYETNSHGFFAKTTTITTPQILRNISVSKHEMSIKMPTELLKISNELKLIDQNHSFAIDKANAELTTGSVNLTDHMKVAGKHKDNVYITIDSRGRLGNEMLQYAALFSVVLKNHSRVPFIDPLNVKRLLSLFTDLTIKPKNITLLNNQYWFGVKNGQYDEWYHKLPGGNLTLRWWFNSFEYFTHAEDEIRREFTFPRRLQDAVHDFFKNITPSEWSDSSFVRVGIHVRRSDRITDKMLAMGSMEQPASYFHRAMDYFIDKYTNAQFIVASDDIPWCQLNLDRDNVVFSKHNYTMDLPILATCDHMITSMGSYGWWAGWLCKGTTIYYGVPPPNGTAEWKKYQLKDWVPPPKSRYNNWVEII